MILWIFWVVITKLDYIKWSFLCILGSFLRFGTEWGILFWVAKISNYYFGIFEILDIFGENGR